MTDPQNPAERAIIADAPERAQIPRVDRRTGCDKKFRTVCTESNATGTRFFSAIQGRDAQV